MPFNKSLVVSALIFFTACTAPVKEYSDQIYVKSTNYKFIDAIFAQNNHQKFDVDVPVWVSFPDREIHSPPYPAIILLHSSWGLSAQESFYTKIFTDMGLAVFAIDSFTPRGVSRTSIDQSLVSAASMIQDAHQVLDYLQSNPVINPQKVALMGFSKGGIVALYSAFSTVNQAISSHQNRFAAHIAYYPWCGLRLYDMRTTGAPILIQGGSKDIITPVSQCEQLINEEVPMDSRHDIAIKYHPKARHAFDHPTLARIPIMLSLNAQVPALCDLRENPPGHFVEMYTGQKVTGDNIKSVLEECSTFNGTAGSNRKATNNALEITKKFIEKHLLYR